MGLNGVGSITDSEILEWMEKGLIYFQDGEVYKWHGGHRRFVALKTKEKDGRKRYQLHVGGRSKKLRFRTIQANKLIYMLTTRQSPNGDVDHVDEDRNNNHPSNLQDSDPKVNRRKNTLRGFEECCKFFDCIVARRHGSLGDF